MIADRPLAVIDTSAIISLRMERYAPTVFPSVNRYVEKSAADGLLLTVRSVFDELTDQASAYEDERRGADPATLQWTKDTFKTVEDTVDPASHAMIVRKSLELASDHQDWYSVVDPADPVLIATGEVLDCAVLSDERSQVQTHASSGPIPFGELPRNDQGRIVRSCRIPDVCMSLDIDHLDLISFFRAQGWSF